MFKNVIVKFLIAFSLIVALTGGAGIIGDEIGLEITSRAEANSCSGSVGSGGGC